MPRRRKRSSIDLPDVDERRTGVIVARDEDGEPRTDANGLPILKRSPHAEAAEKWMALLFAYAGQFGMTPAARARINHGMKQHDGETNRQKKKR